MIRFESITKRYRGTQRPALSDIDLEVLRGEFVFLVGASGSGKSSCLRLILKEEKPTSGRLHVLGQNLGQISTRKVPYFRRNIGVVFQDFRLLPNKTVFQNVAFSLQVIGKSRGFIQEAVPDVLEMVGLEGKAGRLPHELSGGEQQRVAIARAAVNKPQILLADEPTGNLDPATSAGIMSVLDRINASGTTVVMATHEAGIVDQMQRRVVELSNGVIVRDERHGGYGYTAAVPVVQVDVPAVIEEPALVGVGAGWSPEPRTATQGLSLSERVRAASRESKAEEPATAEMPRAVAPEEKHEEAPVEAEPTTESDRDAPALVHDDANFASPPTRPVPFARTGEHDLPEQLGLAARLGLRTARHDDDADTDGQDVGPVR